MGKTRHLDTAQMKNLEIPEQIYKKAIKILKRNYGCPGKDGLRLSEIKKDYFTHLDILQELIYSGEIFKQKNFYRTQITDYTGQKRNIFVYNIYTRWYQQCIRILIEKEISHLIHPYVYSYKRNFNELPY